MEHLLYPPGARPLKNIIPYLQGEDFDADGRPPDDIVYHFKSYWDRKHWERHPLTGDLVFHGHQPREIAQSLQASLYFGTLISVFAKLGFPVSTQDFLEKSSSSGETFVSTKKLSTLLMMWTQRGGIAKGPPIPDVKDNFYQLGLAVKEMLNWTFYYLTMFRHESETMADPDRDRMQLIELSIMAMGESLCAIVSAVFGYNSVDMPTWGPSPILTKRLLKNGWCISDSPFFPESMARAAISTEYYFSDMKCPRPRLDHSQCSPAICLAYTQKINLGTYRQKHTTNGCRCDSIPVPAPAFSIVSAKKIPVLQWDGQKLRVAIGGPKNPYVAISHVWSDGLGNDDKNNTLWACQLTRIQSLVDALEGVPRRQMPFWIDTLCVPVGASKTSLRKLVIAQMADIYREASHVLVLDNFILKLPLSADVIHKYLHIHLSTWHHRLWTMQEGQLARRLSFQFQGGAETLDDMKSSGLHGYDSSLPKNLSSPVQLLCASELDVFYREIELSSNDRHPLTARMRSCARYLRSRDTSRAEDESVCVANILGLKASEVLKEDEAVDRMSRFYDLVGQFDPRLIFHDHPHLLSDGYRWAPETFLRQLPDLLTWREGGRYGDPPPVTIIPNGGGLPVRFGGFEFTWNSLLQSGVPVYIKQMTDGRGWVPKRPEAPEPPWFACIYQIEVQDVLENPPLRQGQRWAVILPRHLERDALPYPFAAVMGIIDGYATPPPAIPAQIAQTLWTKPQAGIQVPAYSVSGRIPFRYVCRVKVTLPPPETVSWNSQPIPVWAYGAEQEWLLH